MQPNERNHLKLLSKNKLFDGISETEIEVLLSCFNAKIAEYKKGDFVITEGDKVSSFGIVLSGQGRTVRYDTSGKLYILTLLKEGSYVSILLAANKHRVSPVSIQAHSDFCVIFFPYENLTKPCKNLCGIHTKFIINYFDCMSEMALHLLDRNDCLIKLTVREKIMTYLLKTAKDNDNNSFSISLDRQGMSEYLNVERSALSRELSRMKQEGLIDYHKNNFKILN